VPFLRCLHRNLPKQSFSFTSTKNPAAMKICGQLILAVAVIVITTGGAGVAQNSVTQNHPQNQDQLQNQDQPQNQIPDKNPTQAEIKLAPITIPAGTLISLVLTHSIQSRYIHHGDDIYAQVTFPVNSGDQVVIPAGTFVQGVVDRLDQSHGRAELYIQGMSITFPDGYIAPIAGPITLITGQGYALKDPGPHRGAVAMALIGGGAGIGALIGHSAGSSYSVQTTTLPAGCTGPPPYCETSSMTVPGRKGFDTGMGLVIGGAAGGVAAFGMLVSSRQFFVDVGTPVDLTLRQPITLQGDEVAAAVREAGQQGVAVQPVSPRPVPPQLPDTGPTFPTNPGTPPTVIPGAPGPGGVPGPPIIIPGTPPGV
jgi:hypothetical protein